MAYNGPRRGQAGQKSKFTSVRLTGLFKTKKRGLCVGTIQAETIDRMIEKIKEAKKQDKEMTVFLWVNDKKDEENQPYFTVSLDVARPAPGRGKAIQDDPFGGDNSPERAAEDDPFN